MDEAVTERRYYSEKHALTVWREDGRRHWQFENNLLILTDPDEIAEFERVLDTLGLARGLIRTVSLDAAQQLVKDFKARQQPGAMQGPTTSDMRQRQLEAARTLGVSASVGDAGSQEVVTPPPGVVAADDPNFTPTVTVAAEPPLQPTNPVILPAPPPRIVIGNGTRDK